MNRQPDQIVCTFGVNCHAMSTLPDREPDSSALLFKLRDSASPALRELPF
jgi:hypothetical protein